jgi:hypothetical protein
MEWSLDLWPRPSDDRYTVSSPVADSPRITTARSAPVPVVNHLIIINNIIQTIIIIIIIMSIIIM